MRRVLSLAVTAILTTLSPLAAKNHGCDALEPERFALATPSPGAPPLGKPLSRVEHLVVIVQENHSFDAYFGAYCQAPAGSAPSCTAGPACCEAAPTVAPGPLAVKPRPLTDDANGDWDPDHSYTCMVHEMNQGAMDGFVTAPGCGHPNNVALADASTVGTYWTWAGQGALADRYFQPVAGATSANDMYFARAGYLFTDNAYFPDALGKTCQRGQVHSFEERTIVDLLRPQGVTMGIFAEGYKAMQNAVALGTCPKGHRDCPAASDDYPCTYDASDIPFAYFRRFADDPSLFHDLSTLDEAIDKGTLPAVTFVKQLGFRTEHPGAATTIQDGAQGVDRWVSRLLAGPQGASTLVLVTFDESGGYFDHVAPPPPNPADGMPYGPRVPMLALGPFARKGHVSHEILEHSSIVKFIEWNWLGGTTGQLGTRDGFVANLGSLLEDRATGIPVPQGR